MHIWYGGRMHTPPVGVTFKFSLLDFKKYIYTIFVIICSVCYACKRTDYKQQYYYANLLLTKILTHTQKKNIFTIEKFKSNASGRRLELKKLNHPFSKGLKLMSTSNNLFHNIFHDKETFLYTEKLRINNR